MEKEEASCTNYLLPIEVLENIFSYLSYSELKSCIEVCSTWRRVVAALMERVAKKRCEEIFQTAVNEAFSRTGLSWADFYDSVNLWAQVEKAKIGKVYSTENLGNRCFDKANQVQYLKSGIIGYPTFKNKSENDTESDSNTVLYIDSSTLNVVGEESYDFTFIDYEENEKMIVFSDQMYNLRIVTKANKKVHKMGKTLRYQRDCYSKFFFIKNANKVFYVNVDDLITMVSYTEENGEPVITDEEIIQEPRCEIIGDSVKAISYVENEGQGLVKILLQSGTISAVVNNNCKYICNVDTDFEDIRDFGSASAGDVIKTLEENGFDWTDQRICKWLTVNGDYPVLTPLFDATLYKYGKVVFVGTAKKRLLVYYNPYNKRGHLNLFKKPSFRIDVGSLCPVDLKSEKLTSDHQRNISHVGAIEIRNGHRLVIIYCQRIVCIELRLKSLKHTASGPQRSRRVRYVAKRRH